MCPFVLLAYLISLLLFILEVTAALTVQFNPRSVDKLKEDHTKEVSLFLRDEVVDHSGGSYYDLLIDDPSIVDVQGNKTFYVTADALTSGHTFNYSFLLKGKFLGHTWLKVVPRQNSDDDKRSKKTSSEEEKFQNYLPISVVRPMSTISKIFTISVAVLVSINYINMGCALDLSVVIAVLKKPVAPLIGFVCQYLFMPLIAYVLGKLLLDQSFLQLGLFTFGCSPGGGASNMWTVLLNGNLNLSITMTFISTLAALFMMPMWLLTLGRSIYEGTTTSVPLHNIFGSLGSMTIFLGLGLAIQKFLPDVAKVCRRILAPVSFGMIIFIIIFGTYANLYMFKLMSWRILTCAALNVWCGFIVGMTAATLFNQQLVDRIAISIETGIQNTGVSIVLLGLSLQQPDADLASVVPVAASVMTPIPLTIAYIFIKVKKRLDKNKKLKLDSSDDQINNMSSKTSSDTLIHT